jgi:hypothetical protein
MCTLRAEEPQVSVQEQPVNLNDHILFHSRGLALLLLNIKFKPLYFLQLHPVCSEVTEQLTNWILEQ